MKQLCLLVLKRIFLVELQEERSLHGRRRKKRGRTHTVGGVTPQVVRATIELHPFFLRFSQLWELNVSPTILILVTNKAARYYRMKNPMTTRVMQKQKWVISEDFGLRSPVIPKLCQNSVMPLSEHVSGVEPHL